LDAVHPPHLSEVQRLPTSGARAAEPIRLGGLELLAVPQLAYDIPGAPPQMNGGDSDTELLLLRRRGDRFEPWGSLPAPGGEDAEFFTIGGRHFLAVAGIRSGAGPYQPALESRIHVWDGTGFAPFQDIPGFAAKQWRHFTVGERHFLALAQGLALPAHAEHNRPSVIYAWNGERFEHFQDIDSRWAYNWHAFTVDGTHFLAHAEHLGPSLLYRWDGQRFTAHQELIPRAGRAFASFSHEAGGSFFLLTACLEGTSRLLRWNGERFVEHQRLDGPGAREFAVIDTPGGTRYVVRVNFIHGTPADNPRPALRSQVYRWDPERQNLAVVEEFDTSGAPTSPYFPATATAGSWWW
jgi:hypothetical protein